MQIETILTPAEIAQLDPEKNSGWTCVVFDVLRATTSIVTAIAHGAEVVKPVRTIEEALSHRQEYGSDWLLGGERHGNKIEGFDLGNSPLEYVNLKGKKIVSTTTNGTIALDACHGASMVYAACLLNLRATAGAILKHGSDKVRIVCAGTYSNFALEDGVAAGLLISLFPDAVLCDASTAMHCLATQSSANWKELIFNSQNGRTLQKAGRLEDIEWALKLDAFPVVVPY